MPDANSDKSDWLSRLLTATLKGPLPLFILLIALVGGIIALIVTPREEEPQIIVPMADVFVAAPGLSAEQVERQIATPLEKLLYQIDGVEYVYSMSRSERCVVTVRFFVGEDRVALFALILALGLLVDDPITGSTTSSVTCAPVSIPEDAASRWQYGKSAGR